MVMICLKDDVVVTLEYFAVMYSLHSCSCLFTMFHHIKLALFTKVTTSPLSPELAESKESEIDQQV